MIYLVPSILYTYFVDLSGKLAQKFSMMSGGGGNFESTYDVE
jgi:hypothetical protein